MQLADSDDAGQHILFLFGIRLVQHAFVPYTLGAGLVGIDPGNDQEFFLYLLIQFRQAVHVFQHGVFPVRGAGPDDQQQAGILSRQHV